MAGLLGKFKVTISPDVEGAGKVTDAVGKEIDGVEAKLGKDGGLGSKLGKGLAVGAAAGVAAIGTLGAAVLKETAAMQQNLGGSEAVFGQYADSIQKWAGSAAATMGISTNEALQTSNVIASIYQGSGISQEKAAEMTMKLSQRAVDAASVMGVETSSAMEAITSAAKGNFEMMDNLGVSMTAAGLEAYRLSKGIDTSYTSMDQAQKAMLAYDYFMEKSEFTAGNFARENQTLAGSFEILGASWQSVLGSVEDEQVMDGAIDGLVTAIQNIAVSISAVLPSVVKGIVRILREVLPELLKELAALLPEVIPLLVDGLGEAIAALVAALPDVIRSLGAAIAVLIPSLIKGVLSIVNTIIDVLPEIISEVINALIAIAPALVAGVIQLLLGLMDALPLLLEAVIGIIPAIINGMVEYIPTMIPVLVEGMTQLFNGAAEQRGSMIEVILGIIPTLIEGLLAAFGTNAELFAAGVGQFFLNIPNELARFAGETIRNLLIFIQELVTTFPARMAEFAAGLIIFFQQLPQMAMQFAGQMVDRFRGLPGEMIGIGQDIIWGLINGIGQMWANLMATIDQFIGGIQGAFLEGLGIHSPSRWMRDHIGENMGAGVGVGLMDSVGGVLRDVDAFNQRILGAFSTDARMGVQGLEADALAATTGTVYNTTVNQQVPASDSALDVYLASKRGVMAGVPGGQIREG